MSIDWSLDCCNDEQFRSIFLIICYAVVIFKLCVGPPRRWYNSLHLLTSFSCRWRVSILHPFKILYVLLLNCC